MKGQLTGLESGGVTYHNICRKKRAAAVCCFEFSSLFRV